MKKVLLTTALLAFSSAVFAADFSPYIEGSLGYSNPDDSQSKTFYDTDDQTNKTYKGKFQGVSHMALK